MVLELEYCTRAGVLYQGWSTVALEMDYGTSDGVLH